MTRDATRRAVRWLAALLAALTIGASGACHKPPSAETRSFYMGRSDDSSRRAARLLPGGQERSAHAVLRRADDGAGRVRHDAVGRARPDRLGDRRADQERGARVRLLPAGRQPPPAHRHGHEQQRHRRPDRRLAAGPRRHVVAHRRGARGVGERLLPRLRPGRRGLGLRAVVVDVPQGRAVDARLRRLRRRPDCCTPTPRRTAARPARPRTRRATTAGSSSTSGTWRGTTTPPCRSRRSTPTAATRPGSGS